MDILSHKKDWRETQTVLLTEKCSAIIQNSLPEKFKDPGRFMIPCTLGDAYTRTALCDLGASINLISASLIKKLCLNEEVKLTYMCLQLADGEVTLRVNEEKFVLNDVKAMQHLDIPEECLSIDFIDSLVEEVNMAKSFKDRLDDILDDTQPNSEELLETSEENEKPPKLELKPLPPP
ncbi:uncharacterized protein LOC130945324 [Arachis stenosperma]|uniref:uncharacterized protein LOC130945324 n=1 Tax=Arachis stenosperma TaxID=217475 RepID=UPI0025AC08DE|nr:uncharacterized protein LOC130945324 [Arachis stenosperma]